MQIGVFLLYFNAVFGLLDFVRTSWAPFLLIAAGGAAAGYGIANERKWGYYLGIAIAAFYLLPFVLFLVQNGRLSNNLIGLAFAVAKFALLIHPQSRDYQRIWFK